MSSKKQCASTRKATKQGTKCKGVCLFWTEWERQDSQWERVLKQDSQCVGGSACTWQGCLGRHPSPAALSPPPHVYSQQPVGWPLLLPLFLCTGCWQWTRSAGKKAIGEGCRPQRPWQIQSDPRSRCEFCLTSSPTASPHLSLGAKETPSLASVTYGWYR